MTRMTGVIFSDLGLASSFMSLDWVQLALQQSLGFAPFPATLNVRPKAADRCRDLAAHEIGVCRHAAGIGGGRFLQRAPLSDRGIRQGKCKAK